MHHKRSFFVKVKRNDVLMFLEKGDEVSVGNVKSELWRDILSKILFKAPADEHGILSKRAFLNAKCLGKPDTLDV